MKFSLYTLALRFVRRLLWLDNPPVALPEPKISNPFFIPTSRSPWVVIGLRKGCTHWRYVNTYRSRREARDWVRIRREECARVGYRIEYRIVRAWIPTS